MSKVFVGLSGGVDSAVSAALLRQQGHDVTGVFIKIWQPEFIECTWREDRLDAMRVAAALDIPFHEIDLSNEYKKEVIDRMLAAYRGGTTPNPDVLCNTFVKFGAFASWALKNGADMIATGHYARVIREGNSVRLLRGVDASKDQTYFLHEISREMLAKTIFPIGELQKSEVRSRAQKLELPNAARPDSQGLCFVGDISLPDFLSRFIPAERGQVLDAAGRAIGEHGGAHAFTLGQRHGFSVTGASEPLYVRAIDVNANMITVSSHKEDGAVGKVHLARIHWVNDRALPGKFVAQARYREDPFPITLTREADTYVADFNEPHVVSPGQSLVLYHNEECLGGGVISA